MFVFQDLKYAEGVRRKNIMQVACLICFEPDLAEQAQGFAGQMNLDYLEAYRLAEKSSRERRRLLQGYLVEEKNVALLVDASGLSLLWLEGSEQYRIQAEFCSATVDYRRTRGGGMSEMIAKAVGVRGNRQPTVLDCTAGLGSDAFILAGLGCEMRLLERVPVVHMLLSDAIQRGSVSEISAIRMAISRMSLLPACDALEFLSAPIEGGRPDVVYLDPMFPDRDKSARSKKEMYVFHEFIGSDTDSDVLLEAALKVAKRRVVVKRPRLAPEMAELAPDSVMEGQRNRYDIYLVK